MQRFCNKLIILIFGIVFGITNDTAAQKYRIVSCQYQINGQVEVNDCSIRIPEINISLMDLKTGTELTSAHTSTKGLFSLYYSSSSPPEYFDSLQLTAKDIDGVNNFGIFDSSSFKFSFQVNTFTLNNNEGGVKYYDDPRVFLIELKPKEDRPCDIIKNSEMH
jgi:hypothetical protein